MNRTHYKEYKKTYFGKTLVFDCVLAKRTVGELVIVYEIPRPMTFLDCELPGKSQSYGYFWPNRNCNVYHWIDPSGNTLLFYVNVSKETTISEDRVEWRDLVVNIAILPDGMTRVLDEDEVPAAMPKGDRHTIETTKAMILRDAEKLKRELESETTKLRSQKLPKDRVVE